MQKQPLLILLIFGIIGIFFTDIFQKNLSIFLLLSTTAFFGLGYFFLPSKSQPWLRSLFLCLATTTLFGTFHYIQNRTHPIVSFEGKQIFRFKINKKINASEKYRKYEITVLSIQNYPTQRPFHAIVNIEKSLPPLDFLHEYEAQAYINTVESPDNNFQFDYAKYLSRKDIYHQIFIKDFYHSEQKQKLSISDRIASHRLNLLQRIDQSALSRTSKDFLKGIILADRTEMNPSTVSDFQKTGLTHLLAISGGHMVIIFAIIIFILKKCFPFIHYRAKIIIALAGIWAFTIFIDYGHSVVRSSLMISIYYIFILLERHPDLLHSVALSALILLSIDTQSLFDIGFQLSYLAVLGIYLFNTPILQKIYTGKNILLRWLANIASISISAQLSTLPLVLYHFHQYSWVSLPANLIIIPFAEILIVFSCFMVFTYAILPSLYIIEKIYDYLISYTLQVIHFLGNSDILMIKNFPFGNLELILSYCILYLLYAWSPNKERFPSKLLYSILMLIICRISLSIYHKNTHEIIKVSNFGDNIVLIKEKNNATMYIPEKKNTPPQIEKLEKFIANPYLTSRRMKEINIQTYPNSAKTLRYGNKEISLEPAKKEFSPLK